MESSEASVDLDRRLTKIEVSLDNLLTSHSTFDRLFSREMGKLEGTVQTISDRLIRIEERDQQRIADQRELDAQLRAVGVDLHDLKEWRSGISDLLEDARDNTTFRKKAEGAVGSLKLLWAALGIEGLGILAILANLANRL